MSKTTTIDNKTVTINDKVNFKLDEEQSGIITDIKSDNILVIEGNFSGMLRSDKSFEVEASRCWLDNKYKTVLEKKAQKNKAKSKVHAVVEGEKVFVGDTVSFKCDVEQYGKISKIEKKHGDYELTLDSPWDEGFEGGYIGGDLTTKIMASDCWVD